MNKSIKILFILLVLFMAMYASVFAAEEFTGTYKEKNGVGKGTITIILDRKTGSVTGSVTGTGVHSSTFDFNATLKGTYDKNKVSEQIEGTLTGSIIFSDGKRLDFSDDSATFVGTVTDSKITGNLGGLISGESIADVIDYFGDFTCTSSGSEKSFCGILAEGISYINNKATEAGKIYYGSKDGVSIKTGDNSQASVLFANGLFGILGSNSKAEINIQPSLEDIEKELVMKLYGKFNVPSDMKPEDFGKFLEVQKVELLISNVVNARIQMNQAMIQHLGRFNSNKNSDLAYNGILSDLLAFDNSNSDGFLVVADNDGTTIYVTKGALSISDLKGKNSVIVNKGQMTSWKENTPPSAPQAYQTGLPEKIIANSFTPNNTSTVTHNTTGAAEIFNNTNGSSVSNNPANPTTFTISKTCTITLITNYHWNNGKGSKPGLIALADSKGNFLGRWNVTARPGQGNAPNVYWDASPNITLEPGTYTIMDSDTATWSCNSANGNQGMSWVKGIFSK